MLNRMKTFLKTNRYVFNIIKNYSIKKNTTQYLKNRKYYEKIPDVSFDSLLKKKKEKYNINFSFHDNMRILCYYDNSGWLEKHIIPALEEFGLVDELYFKDEVPSSSYEKQQKINGEKLYNFVKSKDYKYDFIFIGGARGHIGSKFLKKVMTKFNIPIINFQLDDKQAFNEKFNDLLIGSLESAKGSILTFTAAKYCVDWYLKENCPAIYLAEGSNSDLFYPDWNIEKNIDVGFFGARYGVRADLINYLNQNGINAKGYGPGWESGFLSFEEQLIKIQRTKILLSHEGIGYNYWPACLKLRNFDYAFCGSAILTSYNSELGDWFSLNDEILCYYNFDDAVDIINYHLENDSALEKLRHSAYNRAIKDHKWSNRLNVVLNLLSK
jgi:hypothetical protein